MWHNASDATTSAAYHAATSSACHAVSSSAYHTLRLSCTVGFCTHGDMLPEVGCFKSLASIATGTGIRVSAAHIYDLTYVTVPVLGVALYMATSVVVL